MKTNNIDNILRKAIDNILEKKEIIELLLLQDEDEIKKLYETAREIRERVFSNKVFLYGFVYFSNYCRNNCNFCYTRKSNDVIRYRKSTEEIVDIAKKLSDSGVHLIDLTSGEDPHSHNENFKNVIDTIIKTKEATNLPIMISPGVVNKGLIDKFNDIGVDWYALYQETHNSNLYKKLRLNQDYDERMNAKLYAKDKGMLIEEGILVGVGENLEDIADSILEMGRIKADQVRVMSFVPQKGIPMEDVISPNRNLEYKIIAILRLMYHHALIPASLDVDGISGLKSRLNSGANVITSIIPPKEGLTGVAQNIMDVDDGNRSVAKVKSILSQMNLCSSTTLEYKEYLNNLRKRK